MMRRLVLAAALLAATALQPAAAVERRDSCYSPAAIEADQAIRYMTDLMVVSSACQDSVYAEFRLRNAATIIAYQHALIAHFHGTARFDDWNTELANEISMKHNNVSTVQLCRDAAQAMAQARLLDPAGFRAYARAQAETALTSGQYTTCGRR
jgi:hypothetical protein